MDLNNNYEKCAQLLADTEPSEALKYFQLPM